MKLGILTVAFPELVLGDIADWASNARFKMLEVACWPVGDAASRSGGATHIDCAALSDRQAADILAGLTERGLEISALGYYPNNLHPDAEHRARVNGHLRHVIRAAARLKAPLVNTFIGGDRQQTVAANLALARRVWPDLVQFAADCGVRIAIENCPMLFRSGKGPGGENIMYAPAIWREVLGTLGETVGLNLDPSHLVWQMIDYERAVHEFGPRIYHVHAKDMEIDRNGLYEHGVLSAGAGWRIPRLPGLGEIRWDRFISALYRTGYDGALIIELEDSRFEGSPEHVKAGFTLARNALAGYVVDGPCAAEAERPLNRPGGDRSAR